MVHQGCKVLVVCGPSGSGKSTLLKRLFDEYPNTFGFSVSHTTRTPRPGEQNGYHYHFTTKEDMEKSISCGEFLESAVFANNIYGTSFAAIQAVCNEGKVCVLDIEVQGVRQIKKKNIDSIYIFIKPPSMDELEKRLRARGTETEESIKSRLEAARRDMTYGESPGNFNLVLENDSLEKAYPKFKEFIFEELEKSKKTNGRFFIASTN